MVYDFDFDNINLASFVIIVGIKVLHIMLFLLYYHNKQTIAAWRVIQALKW